MYIEIEKIDAAVPLPKKTHDDDAAYDLYAAESADIQPFEVRKIKTGLKIKIPKGHVGIIKDRSSVGANTGLLTKAGVIDAGYRGEWQIVMVNISTRSEHIEKYSRIAQFLVIPIASPEIMEVKNIEQDSRRGEKSFGSSGMK